MLSKKAAANDGRAVAAALDNAEAAAMRGRPAHAEDMVAGISRHFTLTRRFRRRIASSAPAVSDGHQVVATPEELVQLITHLLDQAQQASGIHR